MAQTITDLETVNDFGKGVGLYRCTVTWAGGTTTGDVVPPTASGIVKILLANVRNTANANAVKVVTAYDATADKEKITLTGTANDTFDVTILGRVA